MMEMAKALASDVPRRTAPCWHSRHQSLLDYEVAKRISIGLKTTLCSTPFLIDTLPTRSTFFR
jgi:hypothetical protein